MEISKILHNGYFDKITIKVWNQPYDDSRIELDDTDYDTLCKKQGINKSLLLTRILVIGTTKDDSDEILKSKIHKYLEENFGHKALQDNKYIIAYENIISIISNKHLYDNCRYDEVLSKLIHKANKHKKSYAIIDRLYVKPEYRKLGISTWLLKNTVSILKQLNINIDTIYCQVGDFSNESDRIGITKEQYLKTLKNIYNKFGLKNIDDTHMYKDVKVILKENNNEKNIFRHRD